MSKILLGTSNPHKQKKLKNIVSPFFESVILEQNLPETEEKGDSFEKVAQEKAIFYSSWFDGYAISTDGGAVIPALTTDEWLPLRTRRFASSDEERILHLLKMMKHKDNRRIRWFEAIALAYKGKLLFTEIAEAMEGTLDHEFNPQFYREGIWLCSITSYPQFHGKNFFELTKEEQEQTEDSWTYLGKKLKEFLKKILQNNL